MLQQYPELGAFVNYLRFQKRYSHHTIVSYQNDLEQFLNFIISDFKTPSIKEISPSIIRTWLAGLKEQNFTSKSINRKISTLKSFFKFLMKEEVIDATPMSIISAPKIGKRLPVYVEEKDMQTLFAYVEFADNWKGRTEKLILQLFYSTGMRISELINLKKGQVDVSYSHLKVLGKGNKERIIPVNKELLAQLLNYISSRPGNATSENVFVNEMGKNLYAKQVYNIVKKHLSLVTTVQKKSPHILRHSFATHLANNGADLNAVKELLGHSSLAATQVYTHNSIGKLKEVFNKAHPKA
ncbi:MAG: tyrosine-type recombinase/integrase [Parafilimonas sp.]|nr:tyrosine-type recombinase/integrase [Parafilimonas sp.]